MSIWSVSSTARGSPSPSLGEFFTLEPHRDSKTFFKKGELTEIGKGGISYLQVGESLLGRSLQILREHYAPGSDTGRIPLTHDGEEGGTPNVHVVFDRDGNAEKGGQRVTPEDELLCSPCRPKRLFRCEMGERVDAWLDPFDPL